MQTQEVYQSVKVATTFTDEIHAAFRAPETAGAAPLQVAFEDMSTPSSALPIISWQWDMDNDGDVDSTDPQPVWTYTAGGDYSVTVRWRHEPHDDARNYVRVVNQADILCPASSTVHTRPRWRLQQPISSAPPGRRGTL
jgi:hypothetical protein